MVDVGLSLQAERRYLDLVAPLAIGAADYVEVAPETLWHVADDGELEPNRYHREIEELVRRHDLGVVAHGTGLSLGSADPRDELRLKRWLRRIRADLEVLRYRWYTDHIGVSMLAGRSLMLPMPLPPLPMTAELVRTRLGALQESIADVGFENTVHYFLLGAWLDEPAWIANALPAHGGWLLLDLHNAWTTGLNLGIDPQDWLSRIDLSRVIEIHVSGGSFSDPRWLPDGTTLRLDSHDHEVPGEVWKLLDEFLPRCPNLRGVTLERMEGSVTEDDVAPLQAELLRLREVVDAHA
ncbi:MAG: DUF692 family protein [Planctomycetota bacterium]